MAPDVRAAGGVLWRNKASKGLQVLVVHRGRYDDWSFPKGKLDPGERWIDAARREVEEETGYVPVVGDELTETRYVDGKGRDKRVRYWAMTRVGGAFTPNDEVDEIAWVSVDEARRRLTYPRDVVPLDSLLGLLRRAGVETTSAR